MTVSIQRFRAHAIECVAPTAIIDMLRELGPEGGDYVVLRAAPERAEAIERNLLSELFIQGAHVAGPPVAHPADERTPDGTYGGAREDRADDQFEADVLAAEAAEPEDD